MAICSETCQYTLIVSDSQDPMLKNIADGADVAVISIGYRLAPEDPFPKGPEDCFDAAEWLVKNAKANFGAELKFMGGEVTFPSPHNPRVMGNIPCSDIVQSAGGHLTVLTAFHLLTTCPSFHLSGLVLNFGAYDLSFLPQARNFSKPVPLILDHDIMVHFMDAFLPGRAPEERKDPSISPLYKDLTGLKLPSALFTCGTEDCLLDDTVFMGVKWQMAGAEAVVKIFPGGPHGFVMFPPDQAETAREGLEVIREYLVSKLK